jgi:putative transcriptional regulator
MTCQECGNPITNRRETIKYDASGLPGVTLENVEVRRCPACGETEFVIPRIEELHGLIASTIIQKPARLTASEIRFLRKHLGWSGADFARMVGATPETVSRWESGTAAMGVQTDRLLRLMVAHLKPIEHYGEDEIQRTAVSPPKPARLRLANHQGEWRKRAA